MDFRPLGGPFITNFQTVNRLADRQGLATSGQYGFNLKYFAPDFNNGTEFGLFFLNYHSRLPLISGRTGTQAGVGNAFGALNAVGAAAQGLARGPAARRGHRHGRATRRGALGGRGRQPLAGDGHAVRDHRREHAARRAATSRRRPATSPRTSTR